MHAEQASQKPTRPEEWTIYNCHIHTFTKLHTPRNFYQWVLSDAELGQISGRRVPVYVGGGVLYFAALKGLVRWSMSLSKRPTGAASLLYPFLLLLQAVMVIPIVVLALALLMAILIVELQAAVNFLGRVRRSPRMDGATEMLMQVKEKVDQGQKAMVRSRVLYNALMRVNPAANDIFERTARFLKTSEQPTQETVFKEVRAQYPEGTVFVILPMDMTFMEMGRLGACIESQHEELMKLSAKYEGQILPFYAADPRHPDIVDRVKQNLGKERGKFKGIKIYPNLGYRPDDKNLLPIYELCIAGNYPVITHCSPGGIWQYGLSRDERRRNSDPLRYKEILDDEKYRNLKICLAHFGGADEWMKHLKGRTVASKQSPWVRTIFDMLVSEKYPNLYADISYTLFTPKVSGLYIDLVDYLKVMMRYKQVREHVLFGSDYYMVERESISEKEASILLRSRLGEDLFKQIAHINPRRYLNLE